MKWANHELMCFSLPLAVTGNVWMAAGATVFALLPDTIEGNPDSRYLKHRGKSHDLYVWTGVLCGLLLLLALFEGSIEGWVNSFRVALPSSFTFKVWLTAALGIYGHLLGDSLTFGGIPVGKNKTFSFRLFKTGEPVEYLITYSLLAFTLCVRYDAVRSLINLFSVV